MSTPLTRRTFIASAAAAGAALTIRFPLGTADAYRRLNQHPDLWHRTRGTRLIFSLLGSFIRPMYRLIAEHCVPGETVVMDNLPVHTGHGVCEAIEATGAERRSLPAYSPDFTQIEMAFSKLKAILRAAAERTMDGLWDVIGKALDCFKPDECANYPAAAGYDAM